MLPEWCTFCHMSPIQFACPTHLVEKKQKKTRVEAVWIWVVDKLLWKIWGLPAWFPNSCSWSVCQLVIPGKTKTRLCSRPLSLPGTPEKAGDAWREASESNQTCDLMFLKISRHFESSPRLETPTFDWNTDLEPSPKKHQWNSQPCLKPYLEIP